MFVHTLWISGRGFTVSPGFVTVVAATVVYYNFHKFSYRITSLNPVSIFRMVTDPSVNPAESATILMGGIVFTMSIFAMDWHAILVWLAMIVLSLSYTFPLSLGRNSGKRLREFPWLKPVLVAAVWAVVTVILPLLEKKILLLNGEWMTFLLARFALVLALCIPFEIRDQLKERNRAVPSLMDYGKNMVFLSTILLVAAAALAVLLESHIMSKGAGVVASLLVPLLLSLVWMFCARADWPRWVFKFGVDGTMGLPWLLLILTAC